MKSPRRSPKLKAGRRTAEEKTRPKCDGEEDPFSNDAIDPSRAIRLLQNGKYFCFDVVNLSKWLKIRNQNPFTREPFSAAQLAKVQKKLQKLGIAIVLAPSISLIEAVKQNKIDIVRQHILAGTDVNDEESGRTALIWASYLGHVEIVRALLAAGADVDAANDIGFTALISASILGYVEIVRALIAAGADLNAADDYGDTALIYTSKRGHVEVVRALLSAGADVDAKNNAGETALTAATKNNKVAVGELLKSYGA